jgi:hypothetical protein
MAAGFVHGVLNSDNINVTGESFDYGPWRFAPTWAPGFTAAYFDHAGLYAFARQPEAIYWDADPARDARSLLAEENALVAALDAFPDLSARSRAAILWRLGVSRAGRAGPGADPAVEHALRATETPIDRFFFDVFGGQLPESYGEAFAGSRAARAYAPRKPRDHPYWSGFSALLDADRRSRSDLGADRQRDDWSAHTTRSPRSGGWPRLWPSGSSHKG